MTKQCKHCGHPITTKHYHIYCSSACRTKHYQQKNQKYVKKWQRQKSAQYAPGKIQCQFCGGWYKQLLSHLAGYHKIPARKYRELIGFDVKKGKPLLSQDLQELYAQQVKETEKNLENGKKYWFQQRDSRAGRYVRSLQTLNRLKNILPTLPKTKKLNYKKAQKIRKLSGKYPVVKLAKKFNVSISTVSNITNNRIWKQEKHE